MIHVSIFSQSSKEDINTVTSSAIPRTFKDGSVIVNSVNYCCIKYKNGVNAKTNNCKLIGQPWRSPVIALMANVI